MSVTNQFHDATKARLASLENRLSGMLQPIPPRKEFVRGLNHRIQTVHQSNIVNYFTNLHFVLILLAGLFTLGLLVGVGLRALLVLFGKKQRPINPLGG